MTKLKSRGPGRFITTNSSDANMDDEAQLESLHRFRAQKAARRFHAMTGHWPWHLPVDNQPASWTTNILEGLSGLVSARSWLCNDAENFPALTTFIVGVIQERLENPNSRASRRPGLTQTDVIRAKEKWDSIASQVHKSRPPAGKPAHQNPLENMERSTAIPLEPSSEVLVARSSTSSARDKDRYASSTASSPPRLASPAPSSRIPPNMANPAHTSPRPGRNKTNTTDDNGRKRSHSSWPDRLPHKRIQGAGIAIPSPLTPSPGALEESLEGPTQAASEAMQMALDKVTNLIQDAKSEETARIRKARSAMNISQRPIWPI